MATFACTRTETCPGAGRTVCSGCERQIAKADALAAQGYYLAGENALRSWRDSCANVACIRIEILQLWKDLRRKAARTAAEDA